MAGGSAVSSGTGLAPRVVGRRDERGAAPHTGQGPASSQPAKPQFRQLGVVAAGISQEENVGWQVFLHPQVNRGPAAILGGLD